jgi:signal recognition particle GTPase
VGFIKLYYSNLSDAKIVKCEMRDMGKTKHRIITINTGGRGSNYESMADRLNKLRKVMKTAGPGRESNLVLAKHEW